jgi:hypothetical protein
MEYSPRLAGTHQVRPIKSNTGRHCSDSPPTRSQSPWCSPWLDAPQRPVGSPHFPIVARLLTPRPLVIGRIRNVARGAVLPRDSR